MRGFYLLISFLVYLRDIALVNAFSSGAGHCNAGDLSQSTSSHGSGSGAVENKYSIDIGGTELSNGGTITINPNVPYTITLARSGSAFFKGFLFRMSSSSGLDASDALAVVDTGISKTRSCPANVVGITHKNALEKSSLDVGLQYDTATDLTLEVTVVESNEFGSAAWHYSSYTVKVEADVAPEASPSSKPSVMKSVSPSSYPSLAPSSTPTSNPSAQPSLVPSLLSSSHPSLIPSAAPSGSPSLDPSVEPSLTPTSTLSSSPSSKPSSNPSVESSLIPSFYPSSTPSITHSGPPSLDPSVEPSLTPTSTLSSSPSSKPSITDSSSPSVKESAVPSMVSSSKPSSEPSILPTIERSAVLSVMPSSSPSKTLSMAPSSQPSEHVVGNTTSAPTPSPSSLKPSTLSNDFPSGDALGDPSDDSSAIAKSKISFSWMITSMIPLTFATFALV